MYSTVSVSKIEELKLLRDLGSYDSSVIFELLEQFNQFNKQQYINKHVGQFDFGTFRNRTHDVVAKQYDCIIKDWKVLNRQYFNTSLNYLSKDMRDDFKYLDNALSCAVICNKIIKLHQITNNPVQLNLEEAQAVDFILRESKKLEFFMFDYQVA